MNVQRLIDAYANIQMALINYLDGTDEEEKYQNLIDFLIHQKIRTNHNNLYLFLRLINKISKYHYRNPLFFKKIEQIIVFYKDEIVNFFTNDEIINIFRHNHIILLFLIEKKLIILSNDHIKQLAEYENFKDYFAPEFSLNIDSINNEKDFESFNMKRKIGENDNYICQLMQKDNIDEFISYVNQNNINLSATIKSSIYETNHFLLGKNPSLIEYSSFFGSIQIFKYLYNNKVKLTSSLWMYWIHSQSQEIFEFLQNQLIIPNDDDLIELINESIKCHHYEVTNYILNNFFEDNQTSIIDNSKICCKSIKYINFMFFPNIKLMKSFFYYLCRYRYVPIVKILIEEQVIDINLIDPIYKIYIIFFE